MQYRTLGRTGLSVSAIGFGAWGIGGGWGTQDDAAAIDALRQAFDLGVNFYDSAYVYGDGHSEALIGQALGHVRDRIVLTSKIPPRTGQWPPLPGTPAEEAYPASWIVHCTERSLRQFKTDCLDVQQLHAWLPQWTHQGQWYETLEKLRQQGKVRWFGISTGDWKPHDTVEAVQAGLLDVVQVIYNLFEQRPAERLLPAALEHHVGIIARVPFEEGLLTGRFKPGHVFEGDDWRAQWMTPQRLAQAQPRVEALEKELDADTPDLATLALKFVLAHPAVSTVIPGMRRADHVQRNCQVGDQPALSDDKVQRLYGHKWFHDWKYPWSSELEGGEG